MKQLKLLFASCLLLCAGTMYAQKYVGGDISLLPDYENANAKYKDQNGSNISGDMIQYFKQQGWNAMRVRLFVDPSKASTQHQNEGVRQDLDYVKALGRRIKEAGLAFMLDFHYSDTWTDPGKHSTPSAWTSTDPDVLAQTLKEYTVNCLNELKAAGAEPDFVQPGNEITYGMLWPTGHCYPNGGDYNGGTFANFAKYLKAGIEAIRAICPQAKIVIQTEMSRSTNVTNFYNTLKNYTNDYDVIGISYYPYYHGTLETLNSVINKLETAYPGKKIQIVETGYYHKWYPDGATYPVSTFPTWPATDDGQLQFTKDLIATLNQHDSVDGLYWWFPEANEYGVPYTNAVTPSGWYNASLFDNETGKAMKALYELHNFAGTTGIENVNVNGNVNGNWYTIDGRLLNGKPQQRGIYINNGRKVIIK